LEGEIELPSIALEEMQLLFEIPPKNPMYDSYPIYEKQVKFFKKRLDCNIDVSKFDYFLEFDSEEN